jgi:hypothetical protein
MMTVVDLLAFCARARCDDLDYQQLAQMLRTFRDWQQVPDQAEQHGLGPLCYVHWQSTGAPIPAAAKQALQGLYLRHRRANRVRMQVLSEILRAYQVAGIEVLVLKGAALACLVYPEPGLRPMRDIDLLVKEGEARRAQQILAELGFVAPMPARHQTLPPKHLAAATFQKEGFLMSVEVHHNLFQEVGRGSMTLAALTTSPLPFFLPDGCPVQTLGYEDMLWHLCRHLLHNAGVFSANRLIWVADLIGFADQFATEIDWDRLKRQHPLILNTLSLLHFLTPLPERLLAKADLKIGSRPQGVGLEFHGWPRSSLAQQLQKGYGRLWRDTFLPAEWWLRLHYGLGSTQPLFWHRWLRHPFYIFKLGGQLLLKRRRRSIL